ncbi:MAG: hypothetical protein HOP17_06055 [Acidobacteria bacterium]|nr:hypothetical protein [Acidobacteriota bacterium]
MSGQVKKKAFTAKFGVLAKTGGISFGEDAFDHYTITVRDAETSFYSKFAVDVVVTVPKDELPDGKIFRRKSVKTLAEQPGPGRMDRGVLALAEMYSLTFRFREKTNGSDLTADSWIVGTPYRPFTGRLEIGKRQGQRLTARLYVCLDDEDKSCAAGTVELAIR